MNLREPTLLLTRPDPHSSEFLVLCETALGGRAPAVISPVMQIVVSGDIPPLDDYQTLIFTSGHAVRRVGEAGLLKGRNVTTVGQGTADLATSYGASARVFGADLVTFLANCGDLADPALHLRGNHTRGDLAAQLVGAGKIASEAIVYDQLAMPPTRAAHALVAGSDPIIAPVFSPRSADLLSRIVGQRAGVTIIAISPAVADASSQIGTVRIADEPTLEAMTAATVASFRQARLVERPADD